ncbi:hypothetical protein HDU92_003308 [Lobulomyces angularis]|nr:hypothetical protein HDU92_003308 [Lobulomyces angularis]
MERKHEEMKNKHNEWYEMLKRPTPFIVNKEEELKRNQSDEVFIQSEIQNMKSIESFKR